MDGSGSGNEGTPSHWCARQSGRSVDQPPPPLHMIIARLGCSLCWKKGGKSTRTCIVNGLRNNGNANGNHHGNGNGNDCVPKTNLSEFHRTNHQLFLKQSTHSKPWNEKSSTNVSSEKLQLLVYFPSSRCLLLKIGHVPPILLSISTRWPLLCTYTISALSKAHQSTLLLKRNKKASYVTQSKIMKTLSSSSSII